MGDVASQATTIIAAQAQQQDVLSQLAAANAQALIGLHQARTDIYDSLAVAHTELTTKIDDDVAAEAAQRTVLLAQLRTDMSALVTSEFIARVDADGALGQRIDSVLLSVGDAMVAISNETTARQQGDQLTAQQATDMFTASQGVNAETSGAMLAALLGTNAQVADLAGAIAAAHQELTTKVNGDVAAEAQERVSLAAQVGDNLAKAQQTLTTYVDAAVGAESQARTQLASQVGSNLSQLQTDLTTKINTDVSAEATLRTQLASRVGDVETAANLEVTTRSTKDNALAQAVNTIWAAMGGADAVIQDGQMAAIGPGSAVATKWAQVEAAVTDPITGVVAPALMRTEMTAYANKVDGTLNTTWSVRADTNGVVSGIAFMTSTGAGSDPASVKSQFMVSTDRFSLVSPTSTAVPFDVQDGQAIFNGTIYARAGVFQGDITGATGTFGGSLAAGVVDLAAATGVTLAYPNPGSYTVYTLPWNGTVRATLIGGGGGGSGGGRGINGGGGAAGSVVNYSVTNVPAGSVVALAVGAGGAGGAASSNPTAPNGGVTGGTTSLWVGGSLVATAAGGAGGSPGVLRNPASVFYHCADYGDFGSGTTSAGDAAAYAISTGGARGAAAFGSHLSYLAANGNPSLLNGGAGGVGGGGGGGAPSSIFVSSRGFYIDPVDGEGGDGTPTTAGGAGGNGYAKVEVFNPNSVVLKAEFDPFKTTVLAATPYMHGFDVVWTGSYVGPLDLNTWGHGVYFVQDGAGYHLWVTYPTGSTIVYGTTTPGSETDPSVTHPITAIHKARWRLSGIN